MANMTLVKTPMPEQDPKVRARNFKEVTLGYTAEMAIEEADIILAVVDARSGLTTLDEKMATEFETALNKLGAEGWELVQRVDGFFFFKREISVE